MNNFNQLVKTSLLTIFALIAFAANSVICRIALKESLIDPYSFTSIRLLSGIFTLYLVVRYLIHPNDKISVLINTKRYLMSGFWLFLYALCFSYAYIILNTGTGALILFTVVQITIVLLSYIKGNRFTAYELFGLIIATGGLTYLFLPELSLPTLPYLFLMSVSGIAWGVYSLKGKESHYPVHETYYAFLYTLPYILITTIIHFTFLYIMTIHNKADFHSYSLYYSTEGLLLAILSGSITSALGYTLWYSAIKRLSHMQIGVVQLCVPVLAILGGVIFVSETITYRIVVASITILCGILITLLFNKKLNIPKIKLSK